MKWIAGAVTLLAVLATPLAAQGHPTAEHRAAGLPGLKLSHQTRIPRAASRPRNVVVPARIRNRIAAAAGSIPMYSSSVKDGAQTFKFTMVGKNPFVAEASPSTTVKTYLVWLDITDTTSGDVYNPAAAEPCDPAGHSPLSRVQASPLFHNRTWTFGVTSVGSAQYVDAFQRSEFFADTKPTGINPGYHVKMSAPDVVGLSFSVSGGSESSASCAGDNLLELPLGGAGGFDKYLQTVLVPFLDQNDGLSTKDYVIFLVHNVAFTDNGCCALGYHSAFGTPAQVYAVADYDTTGDWVGGVVDVADMSHEIAETWNDPFGNNPTKPWGHIGQVTGCQSNLEVGDPLTNSNIVVSRSGFQYHLQELADFSWFYHQSPSLGVNGWYSDEGTFRTAAAACS